MSIPEHIVESIKETMQIAEVVSDFTDLKQRRAYMVGLCPLHEEKTPSFHVYIKTGTYKCYGCGAGGDAIDFLRRKTGEGYPEVLKYLAGKYNIPIEGVGQGSIKPKKKKQAAKPSPPVDFIPLELYDPLLDESLFPQNNYFIFLSSLFGEEKVLNHFRSRGLGTSSVFRNDNGYAVTFPYFDREGRLRQVKAVAYNPETGKRIKNGHSKIMAIGKDLLNNDEANLSNCFYNEIELSERPTAPVMIFESEKTADILSLFNPEGFIYLAAGGQNGCKWYTPEDIQRVATLLKGREVILMPDLHNGIKKKPDEKTPFESWTAKAAELRKAGLDVICSDDLEQIASEEDRNEKLDYADFVIRDLKAKPMSPPTDPIKEIRNVEEIKQDETIPEANPVPEPPVKPLEKESNVAEEVWPVSHYEEFFKENDHLIPSEPWFLDRATTVRLKGENGMIRGHLEIVKGNNGKPTFLPYWERLVKVYEFVQEERRAKLEREQKIKAQNEKANNN